jgi:hypothetical protein
MSAPFELAVAANEKPDTPLHGETLKLEKVQPPQPIADVGGSPAHLFKGITDVGEHHLAVNVQTGVSYHYRLAVLPGQPVDIEVLTSRHSASVSHFCFLNGGDGAYRTAVTLDISKYWDGRAREKVGFARDQIPPTYFAMNRLITAAYAELYLSWPEVFKWAGMAALASHKVGEGLQQALAWSEADIPWVPGVDFLSVSGTEVMGALATGNMAIFAEMYPQHLAYKECGLEMLLYEYGSARVLDEPLAAWRTIDTGRKQGDIESIWHGNTNLLHHEQDLTVQEAIYNPHRKMWKTISEDPTAWFIKVNSPIPGDPTPFAGDDIGDFTQRWRWVITSMLPAWRRLEADQKRLLPTMKALAQP